MKRQLAGGLKTFQRCKFLFFADEPDKTEIEKILDPAQMLEVAKQKGAGSLLVPVLLRYHELVGSKIAAASPASVVFHLHIIRVEDSKTSWSFTYDETQRPLSENVLEFNKLRKRGFKWVKAEQLLAEGIEKAMKAFPPCGETPP